MKTNFFKTMALLSLALLFFACNKDASVVLTQEVQENVATSQNETFVSITKAADIAAAFFATQTDSPVTKSNARIASTETIRDSKNNNEPMMYVMNYTDGGFAIVGATKNYYPILAYSDENNFVYNEEIGGLVIWMEETQEAIRQSVALDANTKIQMRNLWSRYDPVVNMVSSSTPKTKAPDPAREAAFQARKTTLMSMSGGSSYTYYRLTEAESYVGYDFSWLYGNGQLPGDDNYCIVGVKINYANQKVGPLINTLWHQGSPFNDLISGLAGCGTIAVAQIMKSYQYPSYNWSNMPDNGATSDTKVLIRDVHNRLGSGSTVNTERAAFQYFGYNATIHSHDAVSAGNQIISTNKPIFMGGYTNSFFGTPTGNGHSWVCAGVDRTFYTLTVFVEFLMGFPGSFYYTSHSHPSFYYPQVLHSYYPSYYFYMNWGWGAGYNAWYVHNDVSTSEGNFSHVRENIYVSY